MERFLREGGRVVSLADRCRKRWGGRGVGKVWRWGGEDLGLGNLVVLF